MSYDAFGGLTDHFGIAGSGGIAATDDLILVDSSLETDALDRADAEDENGDIADATWHGNSDGNLKTVSCTYRLKAGSLDLVLLYLGEEDDETPGWVIESIEVSTDNGEWPTIEVSGKLGTQEIEAPGGTLTNRFYLPSVEIHGRKQAQELGFDTDAGCRLTSSSWSASIDLAQTEDGVGEPAAHGVSGGVLEGSADFVAVTTAPGWSVTLTDAEETQPPGIEEGQAEYHTGTGTFEYILTRHDTA